MTINVIHSCSVIHEASHKRSHTYPLDRNFIHFLRITKHNTSSIFEKKGSFETNNMRLQAARPISMLASRVLALPLWCWISGASPTLDPFERSGLNSHYFHIIGDGKLNPIVGFIGPHYKDSLLKVGGFPSPITRDGLDHGTFGSIDLMPKKPRSWPLR